MPTDDCIKRSDAVSAVQKRIEQIGMEGNPHVLSIRQAVRDVPAADVEPVRHGYYIGTEFDGYADGNPVYYEWKCSECDCVFEDDEPKYRYCPNCGAKMDAEPPKEGEDE